MGLISKLFATLEAAALKNEATSVGCVSFHKAVLSFALALVRLISTFWHKIRILYSLYYIVCKLLNIIPQFSTKIKKFSTRKQIRPVGVENSLPVNFS